jgi:hypothetical protein
VTVSLLHLVARDMRPAHSSISRPPPTLVSCIFFFSPRQLYPSDLVHRLIPLLTFTTTSLLRCPTLFTACHHLVLLLISTTTSLLRHHLLSTTAPVGIWVPNHGRRSNSRGKGDVRIAGLAEDFPITKLLAFDFLMELYF